MGQLWTELRHAFRVLVRNGSASVLAILCLGLGIGLQATIFAAADPWLFRPLPYAQPDRLAALREIDPKGSSHLVSTPSFFAWKEKDAVFSDLGAFLRFDFNLSTEDEPERIAGAQITASLFPLLGAKPVLGRTFTTEEDRPGGPAVCLISHEMWQQRFGYRTGVLGESLKVDGEAHTIVGVMPPGWAFPEYAQAWTPIRLEPGDQNREERGLDVIARLRPDVSFESAQGSLSSLATHLAAEYPETNAGWGVRATPLLEDMTPPGVRVALVVMIGAAGFVLLIACVNVANILLAQGVDRRREIATRVALGAGAGRLLRQMLIETLLLAGAGGALGVFLAVWGTDAMGGSIPARPPFWALTEINTRVLLASVASCIVASVVAGLMPALEAARLDVRTTLQEGARGSTAGLRARRLGSVLVATELAASVVLLSGAFLMMRSFHERQRVDLGFEVRDALVARLTLSGERYGEPAARYAFLDEVLRRVRAVPGVESAATTTSLPISDGLGGGWTMLPFAVEGLATPPAERPATVVQAATDEAFAALGIAILKGRAFRKEEVAKGSEVAVVSEGLARRFWPGTSPLERRLRVGDGPWLRVVGVAREVREPSSILGADIKPPWQVYLPYLQQPSSTVTLVVRGKQPATFAAAVREEVRGLDRLLPVYDVRTLMEARQRADWLARLWGQLLAWAAGAGALLACVGVYGVVGRSVARRTNEIGVRMALGADRRAVLGLVFSQSLRFSLVGLAAGLVGALALTQALSGLLYGVSASDPWSLLASALALGLVAAVATYLPAQRAATVDPIAALRSE
jgi:putative ABC transport system permease protein